MSAPETPPVAVSPIGDTEPGFEFRARLGDPDPDDPIASLTVEVQALDGTAVWDTDPERSPDWPEGESRVAQPGSPGLPVGVDLQWRERCVTRSGVAGPWSDWTAFRLTRGGLVVEPVPVGTVATLVRAHLQATVALPPGATSVTSHEVQLVARAPAGSPAWDHPLWDGGPIAPVDPLPWFDSLDGCRAVEGMHIDSLRPRVRLSMADPIRAYSWRLSQHGHTVDEVAEEQNASDGISDDGRCLTFTPSVALLRRGKLPEGYFFPPFDADSGEFHGITYGPGDEPSNPCGHHAYAVDFNHGSGAADLGLPVLAAAAGHVSFIDASEAGHGTIQIRHFGGQMMTQYTHMQKIRVELHQRVRRLQQVGEIGSVGAASPHLHHSHFRRLDNGEYEPVKMRFGRVPVDASLAGPRTTTPECPDWVSPRGVVTVRGYRGWPADAAATLRVNVRSAATGEWSGFRRLRFVVSRTAGLVAPCDDPGCGAGSPRPDGPDIDHIYDGAARAPGQYSLRYRATDDSGDTSPWAYDHSVVIADPP